MNQNLQVGELAVYLQKLKLPIGLMIDEVTLQGTGIDLATNPFSLKLSSPATFRATVHEVALTEFLRGRLPSQVESLALEIKPGKIEAEAAMRFLIPVRGRVSLDLVIKNEKELHVRVLEASLAQGLIESQIEKNNPMFSMNDLPVEGRLISVILEDRKLVLEGVLEGYRNAEKPANL